MSKNLDGLDRERKKSEVYRKILLSYDKVRSFSTYYIPCPVTNSCILGREKFSNMLSSNARYCFFPVSVKVKKVSECRGMLVTHRDYSAEHKSRTGKNKRKTCNVISPFLVVHTAFHNL